MKLLTYAYAAIATLTVAFAPSSSHAQVEWLNPEGTPGIQAEFTAGSFDAYYKEIKFPTSSSFLTIRGRVSPTICLVTEFTYFATKVEYGRTSELGQTIVYKSSHAGFANPYFGLELSKQGSSPLWNVGFRLPLISEENTYWAFPSQLISSHRFLAYWNKMLQISSNWGYRYVAPGGFGIRATVGGQLAIPDGADKEFFLDPTVNLWYKTSNIRLMTAFSSLYLLTQEGIPFEYRHETSVSFAADIHLGHIEPGVHVQFPIGKNLTYAINHMYGVHLAYHFGTK